MYNLRPEALPGLPNECGFNPDDCYQWDGTECENCNISCVEHGHETHIERSA